MTTTIAIIYVIGALYTAASFWFINKKYYGTFSDTDTKALKKLTAFIGLVWFFGLPVYMWYYRTAIKGVMEGRDWADDSGASEELKALMRMKEEDALVYLNAIEREFVRQIDEVAANAGQDTDKSEELLN